MLKSLGNYENFCHQCERNTMTVNFRDDDGMRTIEHFCTGCGFYNVYEYEPDPEISAGERFILADFTMSLKLGLNRVISVLGPPGSGKSYTGLKLGDKCDKRFDIDNVVFSGLDYIKAISNKNNHCSFILWDDAGLGAPARKYMSPENIGVGLVAQSSRFRLKRVWTTIPDRSFIDSQPRKLVDIHLEFNRRIRLEDPVSCKIFYPDYNPRKNRVYYKHPRIYLPKRGPIAITTITIKDLPRKSLRKAYEEKKDRYLMDDVYPRIIQQIEDGGIENFDVVRAKCFYLLCKYSDERGQTRIELARKIGIRPDSLSRAYGKVKRSLNIV